MTAKKRAEKWAAKMTECLIWHSARSRASGLRRHILSSLRYSIVLLAALLIGCESSLRQKIDEVLPEQTTYKSSTRADPLEIPPDLTATNVNDALQVPTSEAGGTRSASLADFDRQTQTQQVSGRTQGVLPEISGLRLERRGDERWLIVGASAARVWPRVRDFWLEQGFIIEQEDPSIGIMQTDWAEQRDRLQSTSLFGGLFGRFSEALYGVAVRDRFRTRLERGPRGDVTEVFISHRGAKEVSQAPENERDAISAGGRSIWEPTGPDPEREAEMLARMLVFFGADRDAAVQQVVQAPRRADRAELINSGTTLVVKDEFPRAWRRTGLALDRVGFTVEDRDRSRGLYYVRYVDPDKEVEGEGGFWSNLKFWEGEKPAAEGASYLISLEGGKDGSVDTQVSVYNEQGEAETSRTASRILALLHRQLR